MSSRMWLVVLALVMAFPALAVAGKSEKNADKKSEKAVKPIPVDTYDERGWKALKVHYWGSGRRTCPPACTIPSSAP